MNDLFFGKVTKKRLALFCFFLLLLLVGGCGSSGGDDPSIDPGPGQDVDMEGRWEGNTDTQRFGEQSTIFIPTKNGNDIEGTLELTDTNGTHPSEDVTGSVSNSTVTISAVFALQGGGEVDFVYEGTVSGDTFSGNVKIFQNGTDTNEGGTFILTKSTTPDPSDFTGEWDIYEEQQEGNFGYVQYSYTVRIEQTGTQATLSKGNEHMTCNVVARDLVCQGTFSFSFASGIYTYDSYTLRFDNNNGLTGEAEWTYTVQGSDYTGQSNLTTTLPEVGSIYISNNMDFMFRVVNISSCDNDSWGMNQTSIPIESGYGYYFRDILTGCYDVRVCEDVDTERCETRPRCHVNQGETLSIIFNPGSSLRLNQIKINKIK